MTYIVTQACAVVRDDAGAQHMFYEGSLLPESGLDKDHVKQLLDQGFIEKVKGGAAPAGDEKPTNVKDILAAVGDDKALAQQYLDEENKAEKPRVSLLEPLQAIVDAE